MKFDFRIWPPLVSDLSLIKLDSNETSSNAVCWRSMVLYGEIIRKTKTGKKKKTKKNKKKKKNNIFLWLSSTTDIGCYTRTTRLTRDTAAYATIQVKIKLGAVWNNTTFFGTCWLCIDRVDEFVIWGATHENGPYAMNGQRRPRSACAFAQTGPELRFSAYRINKYCSICRQRENAQLRTHGSSIGWE